MNLSDHTLLAINAWLASLLKQTTARPNSSGEPISYSAPCPERFRTHSKHRLAQRCTAMDSPKGVPTYAHAVGYKTPAWVGGGYHLYNPDPFTKAVIRKQKGPGTNKNFLSEQKRKEVASLAANLLAPFHFPAFCCGGRCLADSLQRTSSIFSALLVIYLLFTFSLLTRKKKQLCKALRRVVSEQAVRSPGAAFRAQGRLRVWGGFPSARDRI